MGQKVNPHGLRVGIIKDWDSRWYAGKQTFGDTLVEDYKVRNYIKKSLYSAGVPKVEIERFADKVRINVYCAKPGLVIGKGGENIEKIRKEVEKMIGKKAGGRLAGAEIARSETYHEGTIPLQTIRADIDYGFAEANTTYGKLGIKVWIYKGEILKGDVNAARERKFDKPERKRRNNNDNRRREGGNRSRQNRNQEGGRS